VTPTPPPSLSPLTTNSNAARALAWLAVSTASDRDIAARVGLPVLDVAELRRRLATRYGK
jgi:hypothetical protein